MTKTRIGGPVTPPASKKQTSSYVHPTERFHTSVTERQSFRTCRRRWYLENIERYQPKTQVAWYLLFGDIMHAALDVYYRPKRGTTQPPRDLKKTLRAFNNAWAEKDAWLREAYAGFYEMGIEEEWEEHRVRGETMLTYYHTFDRTRPFFDEVIDVAVEDRAWIDILTPDGDHIDNFPLLSGRIDLVVQRSDGIWIIDHKTLASAPNDRALDVDDQLTAYCYIWWRLTGEIPRGVIYNVLLKNPPKPPRVLADGKLSRDKAQRTTFELYMAAIEALGYDPKDYEEILKFLSEKGWSSFFVRPEVQRNLEELQSFERHLYFEYEDMREALDNEDKRYHNASQYTCPGCSQIPICQSMEEQGNTQYVIENMYEVQEPRVVIPANVLSEKWKGV
jgi:RecB family exonuclease